MMLLIPVILGLVAWMVWDVFQDRGKPGPRRWPFVGIIPELIRNLDVCRDWTAANFRAYGATYFFRSTEGRGWATVDPRNTEWILKTNFANYGLGEGRKQIFDDFLGDGIFNADGHLWQVQRKTASHEFSASRFRNFMMVVFVEHAELLASAIEKRARKGLKFDMQELVSRYTLDSIGKIAFGVDLGNLKHEGAEETEFSRLFTAITHHVSMRFMDPFWRLKRRLRVGGEAQFRKNITQLDDFSYGIIRQRRTLAREDLEQQENLLSRFMVLQDADGLPVTDKFLRDIVYSFLLAGRDTTANCLTWLFYVLATNPKVDEKLRHHIEESLPSGKQPTYDVVRHMHYLHAVVSETLRLYPSVPEDPKMALKDDVLPSGHKVKAGYWVSFVPYSMGRMEELWGPDAGEVNPDRWIQVDGTCRKESPFKFTAFQGGPRQCLGMDMAYLEVKVAAITLLRRFRFTLVPGHKVIYDMNLTLPAKYGLHLTAEAL
eukprot:TRINITY_DN19264_c0_g1_i1.p1 TRINITY_DN19264_c0_g1~~TRINITY_DN19264_c0_g1_i1.p1  ORF type:complete len:488 (+),score=103.69 TRINITY_DN19264_c0_g1_i1:26-1489(+)